MENTKATDEFNEFLESIGGLENGYFTDRPPIKDRYFFSIGDGWLPLVRELIEKAIAAGWDKQICQVKEKFGGLRFYINSAPQEVWDIIEEYEKKSNEICEHCGNEGKPRGGGWIQTLCDECNEKEMR
jgi:hypothetical protein